MKTTQAKSVAIIGPGNVGTTLAILAAKHGYDVYIGARNIQQAEAAAKQVGANCIASNMQQAVKNADLILITVSDDAIEAVCNELSTQHALPQNAIVAHCSGALDSDILTSAEQSANCAIASMHPLQSFPNINSALKNIDNTYCYYEGNPTALDKVKSFVSEIGMTPILINKQAKVLYHIVGVTACNYLSSLMDTALEVAELADIDRETMWQSLFPLISATLSNINQQGTANALTGPIERGDIRTIRKHVDVLLKTTPEISHIYATLGVQTTKLALRKKSISIEIAEKILGELEKLKA